MLIVYDESYLFSELYLGLFGLYLIDVLIAHDYILLTFNTFPSIFVLVWPIAANISNYYF